MIDRIRRDIQDRLEQVLAEADKLRRALAALGSHDGAKASRTASTNTPSRRGRAASAPRQRAGKTPVAKAADGSAATTGTAPTKTRTRSRSADSSPARTRTASGATKSAVLAALASGNAMTAGEVAGATGLGRATVSTTLSKLAKSGEVSKAQRGYQLVQSATPEA